MELFASGKTPRDGSASETAPIRSGRVGPIRFGATETSYAMTKTVLTELEALPADAGEDPVR
jgi:hypothetical protein